VSEQRKSVREYKTEIQNSSP